MAKLFGKSKNNNVQPPIPVIPKHAQIEVPGMELDCETFRHNETDKLCDWVNDNKIKLQTIAADGNRFYAFYWKKLESSNS